VVTSFEVLNLADEPWVLLGMCRWVYRTVNLCDRTEIILPAMSHTEPDNIAVDAGFTFRLTFCSPFTSLKIPGGCCKKAVPGWHCHTSPGIRLWNSGVMTVPGEIREGPRRKVCSVPVHSPRISRAVYLSWSRYCPLKCPFVTTAAA
jgi:hypothetical protein